MTRAHTLTPILPCNDLDRSEAFYRRLGFVRAGGDDGYRILADGKGGALHLAAAPSGWLTPKRNPFGIYLYTAEVDALAEALGDQLLHEPEHKPWGMYECALSDPDETLVRVGWPSAEIGSK